MHVFRFFQEHCTNQVLLRNALGQVRGSFDYLPCETFFITVFIIVVHLIEDIKKLQEQLGHGQYAQELFRRLDTLIVKFFEAC